jgi:hypothetical protein
MNKTFTTAGTPSLYCHFHVSVRGKDEANINVFITEFSSLYSPVGYKCVGFYERTAMLMEIQPPVVKFIRELWNTSLILLSDKWKELSRC